VRSITAVVIAAAGPLAIAVLRLILPYDTTDDAAATATKVAGASAAEGVVLWLTYLALLTLPLGVLIASRQAMRARPAPWRPWSPGRIHQPVRLSGDRRLPGPGCAHTGTSNSTTAALLDAINALPATSTASIVFVAGTSWAGSCSASRCGGQFLPVQRLRWQSRSRCISCSRCSFRITFWTALPGH